MKKKNVIFKLLIMTLLAFFLMGATKCQTETNTVILPEGQIAAALGKTKDEQIKGLYEQVMAEITARELERKQASLAAANFETILFAATHVETGLPRNAIEEEAKLGKERSPTPDPQEIIRGKDRVIAILQNDVAKAKELYGKAFDEAKQAKAQIEQKDKEIKERDEKLTQRNERIAQLEADKIIEVEKHKKDVKEAFEKKDREFADYKKAEAEKERRWLTWATRAASLGLIVIGVIVLAVFKMPGPGAGIAGSGILVGLISIGIEMLTAAWWFPYLAGFVFLCIGGFVIYGLWRLWIKHNLDDKKTQAIQDMIDEATAKRDTAKVEELKEHLEYRMGKKDDFWAKQQLKEVQKLGLVNAKGEEALKKQNGGTNL